MTRDLHELTIEARESGYTNSDIAEASGMGKRTARRWYNRPLMEADEYMLRPHDDEREAALCGLLDKSYSGPADAEREPFEVVMEALRDTEPTQTEPSPSDLTQRETYVARRLQQGASVEELADDLGERPSVVTQHLKDLRARGWHVYGNEDTQTVGLQNGHVLRSSEHKATRTKKANEWWQRRHNELVRSFRGLEPPNAALPDPDKAEDWVTHMTDLHAGDCVRAADGTVVYSTSDIPDVIDYVTSQSLGLAERHNAEYDAGHLLWGGDFITNEAIYEGQFEDLDAWLDEQHEVLLDPLLRQLKAFSRFFRVVQVVCKTGNHGEHRASGNTRQANADLILYKSIRNIVAQLQQHAGILENICFRIGQSKPFRNFEMRGGRVRGHLRHGQYRSPQADTSARRKEWLSTLLEHRFDVAYMGHHHVPGLVPWDGPPVIVSGSPKPAGEFVESLGSKAQSRWQSVGTAHGFSDDGITSIFPIDTRNFD